MFGLLKDRNRFKLLFQILQLARRAFASVSIVLSSSEKGIVFTIGIYKSFPELPFVHGGTSRASYFLPLQKGFISRDGKPGVFGLFLPIGFIF